MPRMKPSAVYHDDTPAWVALPVVTEDVRTIRPFEVHTTERENYFNIKKLLRCRKREEINNNQTVLYATDEGKQLIFIIDLPIGKVLARLEGQPEPL